jgi:CHAD domain-containing protein
MTRPLRSLVSDAIQQRVCQLAKLQTTASREAELVHEIRVAAKQFRALLQFLRPTAAAAFCDAQDRALGSAARSLAANRDLVVIRETLERVAHQCDWFSGRDSLHRLLLHLRAQRTDHGRQGAPLRQALASLTRSAAALRARLQRGPSDAVLLESFRKEYRRARRLTAKCRRKPGKESWHRWRKQVKALHYQAASLEPMRPRRLGRLAQRCWRLQVMLGRHHDLHITRERLRRLRIDPINEPCRTRSLHALDREIARREKKILRVTESFPGKSSKDFAAGLKQPRND